MLGWLRLLFTNRTEYGHEGHMDEGDVLSANPELELTQGFHVGRRFNVANRSTKFDDAGVRRFATAVGWTSGHVLDPILDSVRDVRDDLNGFSEVVAATFGFQDLRVDFARREVVVL